MTPFIDVALKQAVRRFGGKRYLSPREAKNLESELLKILNRSTVVTMGNLDDFAIYESQFITRLLGGRLPYDGKVTQALRLRKLQVGLDTGKNSQSLPVMLKQFNAHKAKEIAKKVRQLSIQKVDFATAEKEILAMGKLIRSQARTLSITLVNHTATIAKDVTYMANRDKVEKVQWISVLDSGTTDFCRNHHKEIYGIGEGPRPPAHFRCRSIMVAILI